MNDVDVLAARHIAELEKIAELFELSGMVIDSIRADPGMTRATSESLHQTYVTLVGLSTRLTRISILAEKAPETPA